MGGKATQGCRTEDKVTTSERLFALFIVLSIAVILLAALYIRLGEPKR